ncbi:restriction endonuclease subunit S [Alcanivorax sp.]|jgi:type I restriction enzyme S subunit|uniref:restriction endonuclease subunit S n=1 Tax=Alcanivorax sp. TaxID=1872427 RepID=UPI0032D99C1B
MNSSFPEGWSVAKVGELSTVKRGASPRPIQDPKWWGGKIGWVRISDVTSSRKYLTRTTQYLSDEGVSKSIQIPVGEVILSICATIGRPIIVGVNACIHDGFVWFDRLKEFIDREYWYYFLASKEEYLSGQRQSGTQGNLNTSIVAELECLLPPLPEQQKIAAILSSVDDVIEKTRAQIDKLKDMKTGMMQELLTKGIGHAAFKDSPVGRIPEGWDVVLLDDVATRGSGHTPSKSKAEYWNGGIDWVSLSDTNKLDRLYISATAKSISEKGVKNSSAVIHPPGIVVLSRDAGIGKSAITTKEMAVSQHFIVWHCSDRLDNHFLYYVMQFLKPLFENIAMGSTIKTIGLSFFKKLTVPLPSLDEQRKIAGSLKSIDQRIFATERKVAQNCKMKKALMQDLLTGKVRVNVDNKENAVA